MLKANSWGKIPIYVAYTIGGCCSNVYTFEKLLKINSQMTTLITFSQYLFIFIFMTIYLTYIGYWKDGGFIHRLSQTFEARILLPIIVQNVSANIGNYVFQFDVPMPTHIIFRSSSAVMTLFLGWCIWNKRYSIWKVVGSVLIAIGISLFTIDMTSLQEGGATDSHHENPHQYVGISLLLLATIMNSLLSLYKESVYQDSKNELDWKGVLYYNYFYGILFYVPFCNTILREFHTTRANFPLSGNVAQLFLANWITQLGCILGVNILVFRVSALSLTIILLIRRFISLFLSIFVFGTELSIYGYVGIFLVICGTFTYSLRKDRKKVKVKAH